MLRLLLVLMLATPPMLQAADRVQVRDGINLNLRAAPSTTAEIIGQVTAEDRLRLLDQHRDFFYVTSEAGQQGWVSRDFVTLQPETAPPTETETPPGADAPPAEPEPEPEVVAESKPTDHPVETAPVSDTVDALQAELAALQIAHQALQQSHARLEEEHSTLLVDFAKLRQSQREAQREASSTEVEVDLRDNPYVVAALALLFFLVAFLAGMNWQLRRTRKRYGGLRL